MKSTEADIRFPILTFTTDNDVWRITTLNILTNCGPQTLKDDMQRDMEIVDSEWRRWRVKSVRKTGRDTWILPWLVSALLSTRGYRIEQELEQLEPISVDEMRLRVSSAIKAHPDYWYDEIGTLLAQIGRASSIADVLEVLGPDDFRSY